jgi:hypothetical protein
MLKLYLYGYFNGIKSSRKLEVETHRNKEVIWLVGGLTPDHWTISQYRKEHGEDIKFLTKRFREFLTARGYIAAHRVAIDGTKVKANTNREMLTVEKIEKRLERLEHHLATYLSDLTTNDRRDEVLEESETSEKATDEALAEKIVALQNEVETLRQQKAILETEHRNFISNADREARLMKSRDGFIPTYNVQFAVDEKHKLIVDSEVTTAESDSALLPVMVKSIAEEIGTTPHILYYYQIRAVDDDGNESAPSNYAVGQLVTHDAGILLVDGTKDGSGGSINPTDGAVDSFYLALLTHSSFPVEQYDIADSLTAGRAMSNADLGAYAVVIWHSDVRSSSPLYNDTTEIREFLQSGGKLLLSGWRLSSSLKQGGGSGTTFFPENSFVKTFLKIDSIQTGGALTQDFYTANSNATGFPTMKVDSLKIPNYNGTLVNMDVVFPYQNSCANILYTYHGKVANSPFEGKPLALYYPADDTCFPSSYNFALFDVPLYYMEFSQAQQAVEKLLAMFDVPLLVENDNATNGVGKFSLEQNYPNPFNPQTAIGFSLLAVGEVTLKVYNVLGKEVVTLIHSREMDEGMYEIPFDASDLHSGMYFVRLQTETKSVTKKILLMK